MQFIWDYSELIIHYHLYQKFHSPLRLNYLNYLAYYPLNEYFKN